MMMMMMMSTFTAHDSINLNAQYSKGRGAVRWTESDTKMGCDF